jgi:hypothetical protein
VLQLGQAAVADGHTEDIRGQVLEGGTTIAHRLAVHNPRQSPLSCGISRERSLSMLSKRKPLFVTRIGPPTCCVLPANWNAVSENSAAVIAMQFYFIPRQALMLSLPFWLPVFHE